MPTSQDTAAVIEVTGLVKHYGTVPAVDGVDLHVTAGEFYGILGPNGAGKTTTLELIEGLREPDAGSITVLGEKPWPRNPALIRRIGVQLQSRAFFERLTVREQLTAIAQLFGHDTSGILSLLESLGLADKADVRIKKLSGGQQQRLAIAGALVHEPEVVFLDEPTAALDPQARRNLWDILRGINKQGRTVILTTHYLDEAEELCDRVAIMDAGRILTSDTPAALIRAHGGTSRITVKAAGTNKAAISLMPGVVEMSMHHDSLALATVDPSATLEALARANILAGLQVRSSTLEDVFLALTGREYRA